MIKKFDLGQNWYISYQEIFQLFVVADLLRYFMAKAKG